MASLKQSERSRLPDGAFAYIDSRGRRLLPIHDEPRVRNALARFDRVTFEDEAARNRARLRLLKAARKYGIVPDGFVAGQLEPQRKLPTGTVTFLMCDIAGSTALLARLGDGYSGLLSVVRRILRGSVRKAGGYEVDARADEFFAAFATAELALRAALGAQAALRDQAWPDGASLSVRMGIHTGRPTLEAAGYVGLAVHTVARICALAEGGQILASRVAVNAAGESIAGWIELDSIGEQRLRGLPQPIELLRVIEPSGEASFDVS
jgi:class 3 adenylate cyclase